MAEEWDVWLASAEVVEEYFRSGGWRSCREEENEGDGGTRPWMSDVDDREL